MLALDRNKYKKRKFDIVSPGDRNPYPDNTYSDSCVVNNKLMVENDTNIDEISLDVDKSIKRIKQMIN